MYSIAYVSNNKIFLNKDGKNTELSCGRIDSYKETLAQIRRRNEWKTSGTGAQFMGTALPQTDESDIYAEIGGIGISGDRLIYGVRLDESGSIYSRSLDPGDNSENLIISGKDIFPGRIDCFNGKAAVSCGENSSEKHIAVYDISGSGCHEYTDGDSIEEAPSFDGEDRIYFSTAGYARDQSGAIAAVQNKSVVCLDTKRLAMDEILSDEKYDFLCPISDGKGGIYCIRQKAGGEKQNEGSSIFMDIILIPYRIFRALFGMLNFFSKAFGGEALKSGGDSKAKQKSEKEMFIEGNLINAEKNLKDAEKNGEKHPGFMSAERVLIHMNLDGNYDIIRKGVLDYALLSDGNIAVSNGRFIIISDEKGGEISAFKADSALYLKEVI
ncbi:MAG: hypothetical protein MR038_00500 [Oscillospiraceae bacterium]|nr:hypothetical protein [Oscillospiraceae bacterium]